MQDNTKFEDEDPYNLSGGGGIHALSFVKRLNVINHLFRFFFTALVIALGTMSGMRTNSVSVGVYGRKIVSDLSTNIIKCGGSPCVISSAVNFAVPHLKAINSTIKIPKILRSARARA